MGNVFQALVVRVLEDKSYSRAIEECKIEDLPDGEVLIRVHYSSLNYKDGLSCIGNRGVTRHYPHTPGIDAAGVVESSKSSNFKSGDLVVVTSYDLGMNTPGGFGQYIRVPANWVMALPKNLTLRDSMVFGTAGFTAALSIYFLQHNGIVQEKGPIVVTGATGGVGSVSVAILTKLGFSVIASTGKSEGKNFLKNFGSVEVIGRDEVNDKYNKPLLKESWAAGIDTVGGNTLATLIKACKENGAIAATGMVSSTDLPTTVFPFILRGVSLLGINAQGTSMKIRREIWSKLAAEWKPDKLKDLAFEHSLEDINNEIDRILAGNQIGRVIVNLQ
tara:strand:+ start:308 stop:1303 length:996 start_codon:yes stop_codon:yes gene_type:complete